MFHNAQHNMTLGWTFIQIILFLRKKWHSDKYTEMRVSRKTWKKDGKDHLTKLLQMQLKSWPTWPSELLFGLLLSGTLSVTS